MALNFFPFFREIRRLFLVHAQFLHQFHRPFGIFLVKAVAFHHFRNFLVNFFFFDLIFVDHKQMLFNLSSPIILFINVKKIKIFKNSRS